MKKDSDVKEQYSRARISRRIYQHYTTREQTTFTLNHHHTTTSDNNRLPENMPRSSSFLIKKPRYLLGGLSKRVAGKPKMFLQPGKGPDAGHISS